MKQTWEWPLLRFLCVNHSFLWIAVLLIVVWIVARVFLAVTSVALHLLWIVAIIAAIIWIIGRVSHRG